MVPHRNEITAFQEMLRETSGLTNGYNNANNANRNNETKTMTRDYTGATMTGQTQAQGQIARFQNMLKETLGLIR